MYIRSWDRRDYPKFTAYVRDDFPKLLKVPNVINALQVWGFMTMEEIRRALEWQEGKIYQDGGETFNGVLVEISELSAISEYDPRKKTWTKISNENELLSQSRVFDEVAVSPKAVRAFEDGKGISITGYGLKVYTVGATMLGQLVYNYAGNHYWRQDVESYITNAKARQRRAGFYGQVYGGTPR